MRCGDGDGDRFESIQRSIGIWPASMAGNRDVIDVSAPDNRIWRQALDPRARVKQRRWCGKNVAALQLALTRGWAQNGSALQWIAAQKMGLVAAMRLSSRLQ